MIRRCSSSSGALATSPAFMRGLPVLQPAKPTRNFGRKSPPSSSGCWPKRTNRTSRARRQRAPFSHFGSGAQGYASDPPRSLWCTPSPRFFVSVDLKGGYGGRMQELTARKDAHSPGMDVPQPPVNFGALWIGFQRAVGRKARLARILLTLIYYMIITMSRLFACGYRQVVRPNSKKGFLAVEWLKPETILAL